MTKYSKIFLSLALSVLSLSSNCAEVKSEIAMRSNERWWGLYVYDSPVQPFTSNFKAKTNQYQNNGGLTNSLLLSSEGRYIWSEDSFDIDFKDKTIEISAENEIKIQKGGRNLREAFLVCCHKNFPPQGEIKSSDLITNIVYETSFELGIKQNQESVLSYAQKILSEGYPKGIISLGDGWQSLGGNLNFDAVLYPEPQTMIDSLHQMGFKIMLTVTPLTAPVGINFLRNLRENLLLKDSNSSPLIIKNELGYQACINISLTEASHNFKNNLNALRENFKIDGFRYDASAVLPLLNDNNTKDAYMREWLSMGEKDKFSEYMPASLQKFSMNINCYKGQISADRAGLIARANNVISGGLSGYNFTHPLSENSMLELVTQDQDMMLAYMQLMSFMPVFSVDFAPWRIKDETAKQKLQSSFETRERTKQHLINSLEEIAKTSEPLIRSMEYQFPRNGFYDCVNQFIFAGKFIVIIPESTKSSKQLVRLPRGAWISQKGDITKGPRVISVDNPKGEIIYFELKN